jgi:tripartite-type tricarboxylate transporter receptor subunit TctC
MSHFPTILACAAVLVSGSALAAESADKYPSRPVRLITGSPGSTSDQIARFTAQKLTERLGQQFIVDNRPGAGGTIATDLVAKAPPDGYTLIMVSVTHSINASLYSKLPYDSVKSFAAVTPVALQADVIAVHPSLPVKTVRELIALAKSKPGDVSYAHAGNGTLMHVGMELFLSMAGVRMLAVPYNGSGPSTLATLGGQVPVLSTSLPPSLPHAKAGKLRILAVTTAQRTPLAPEYPTVEEAAGLKGYEAVVWIGLLAPAATPPSVVNKLNADVERVQQTRELREQMSKQGTDPYRDSPAQFADLIRNDVAKWGRIVHDTGLKSE